MKIERKGSIMHILYLKKNSDKKQQKLRHSNLKSELKLKILFIAF